MSSFIWFESETLYYWEGLETSGVWGGWCVEYVCGVGGGGGVVSLLSVRGSGFFFLIEAQTEQEMQIILDGRMHSDVMALQLELLVARTT